jgi:single-strand DNA-binding protein
MKSLNKVMLIGNLTRDPEARETQTGQVVATFTVATNRVWTNTQTGERQQSAEFHDLVAWSRLAETCDKYLRKGMAVYVEGRLATRSWEAQDGSKRNKTEIILEEMNILTPKGDGPLPENENHSNDNSQSSQAPIPQSEEAPAPTPSGDAGKINVDDILDF